MPSRASFPNEHFDQSPRTVERLCATPRASPFPSSPTDNRFKVLFQWMHLQFEFQFEIEACRLDSPTSLRADTIAAIRRIRTSSFHGASIFFSPILPDFFFFLSMIMFHQSDFILLAFGAFRLLARTFPRALEPMAARVIDGVPDAAPNFYNF